MYIFFAFLIVVSVTVLLTWSTNLWSFFSGRGNFCGKKYLKIVVEKSVEIFSVPVSILKIC
jgi:hypothetical protein